MRNAGIINNQLFCIKEEKNGEKFFLAIFRKKIRKWMAIFFFERIINY